MYLSAEDARSDVILTGATVLFGGIVLQYLGSIPGYPSGGVPLRLAGFASVLLLTALVPFLLARYRDDLPGAFALSRGALPWSAALLLAAPAAVAGIARGFLETADPLAALLGRAGPPLLVSPVVSVDGGGGGGVGVVLGLAEIVVLSVGTVLLLGFLTVRGRDAWRSDDRSATEVLRTLGLGAAALALVLGSIRAVAVGGGYLGVLVNAVAAAAVVLVADAAVPADTTVERQAILTPTIVIAVGHVLAAGGLFRGDLLSGIYRGALAAAVTLAIAVTIEHRRHTAVVIPLVVALQWWPGTCLGPLPFAAGGC